MNNERINSYRQEIISKSTVEFNILWKSLKCDQTELAEHKDIFKRIYVEGFMSGIKDACSHMLVSFDNDFFKRNGKMPNGF